MTATAIATGLSVTLTREALRDGLRAVAGALAKRSTLDVMKMFRVAAEDGNLTITASDFDHWVTRIVPAEVTEPGVVLLPSDTLMRLVDRLPPDTVRLSVQNGNKALLKCGAVRSTFQCVSPDEYPAEPEDATLAVVGRLALPQLTLMAHRAGFAASDEQSRPILNGILCELHRDRLRMVAADQHRLSVVDAPLAGALVPSVTAIVAPETFAHAGRCLASDAEVEVSVSPHSIAIRGESGHVFSRLIDGPYPPYQNVLPRESKRTAVVDREALLAAIGRMVFASGEYTKVAFAVRADEIALHAEDGSKGKVDDAVPCRLIGDEIEFGASARYLTSVLAQLPTAEVRLEMTTAERAIVIKPEGWSEPGEMVTLVMPMRLT